MKHLHNRSIIMKDYERLELWRNGLCPYCGSVGALFPNGNGLLGVCSVCPITNRFSGAILKRATK